MSPGNIGKICVLHQTILSWHWDYSSVDRKVPDDSVQSNFWSPVIDSAAERSQYHDMDRIPINLPS